MSSPQEQALPPLPPGPSGAELRAFWRTYLRDPGGALRSAYERFGPTFRIRTLGGECFTCLVGPEAAHEVLSARHEAFQSEGAFNYLDPVAPTSLLRMDGEVHARLRRAILPAFTRPRVARYVPMVSRIAEQELTSWRPQDAFDMAERMRLLTFRVLMLTLLSTEEDERHSEIVRAIAVLGRSLQGSHGGDRPSREGFLSAQRRVEEFIDDLVRSRGTEDHGDVLSVLLNWREDDGSALERDVLRDQLWSLMFAGHDTTAHALAWGFYLMAQSPAAMERARLEIAGVMNDKALTAEALENLPFLDAVIREVLRLYPSAPSVPRITREPFEWQGYQIPKGELVVCLFFLTHRLPTEFPDPDAFRPDRWLEDSGRSPSPFAFTPFGIGPRLCPGSSMAVMEMKVVLAMALPRFDFEVDPGQTIVAFAAPPAMRPVPGIRMRVRAAPSH